jgi:septal ring factor EnvC (AmiA/AmiB activator)
MNFTEIKRAKSLLTQALGATSYLPQCPATMEAKKNIKRALQNIEEIEQSQYQKRKANQTQHESWWKNIEAGVANMPVTSIAEAKKSLEKLNAMISTEQQKIKDLEKQSNETETDNQLLND